MSASFHHGTETRRIDGGSSPVYTVNGAITAIVGTAPIGDVNVLTLCQTAKDFAKFGGDEATKAGFTIPDAAHIWTRYKAGIAYVVNVCDPARHKTVVADEVLTVDANTLIAKTAKPAIQDGYVVKDGQAVLDTSQYEINTLTGEIRFITYPSEPMISYTYTDPDKVTEADILGGFVASSGKRTGLELLTEGFGKFGADAKIIIVPEYDKTATASSAMITMANKLNAITYINAPKGTTLSAVLQGRGANGTINFNTSSDRAELCYPYVVGILGD